MNDGDVNDSDGLSAPTPPPEREPPRAPELVLADRRRMLLLLLPHAIAILALITAFGVIAALDTNRSELGLQLALTAAVAGAVALFASLVGLLLFPWTKADRTDWLLLGAHGAALGAIIGLGYLWIGAHLA